MITGLIVRKSLPDGRWWFKIDTDREGLRHRSYDHAYDTEEEARDAAAKECDRVDPILYTEYG